MTREKGRRFAQTFDVAKYIGNGEARTFRYRYNPEVASHQAYLNGLATKNQNGSELAFSASK